LVVFAGMGDTVSAASGEILSLAIEGAEGAALEAEPDNLVLRAARALTTASGLEGHALLHLLKRLPVASGIGGGSADAAASLRALNRLWGLGWSESRLAALGATLGADVPVCVGSRPARMEGIGENTKAGCARTAHACQKAAGAGRDCRQNLSNRGAKADGGRLQIILQRGQIRGHVGGITPGLRQPGARRKPTLAGAKHRRRRQGLTRIREQKPKARQAWRGAQHLPHAFHSGGARTHTYRHIGAKRCTKRREP